MAQDIRLHGADSDRRLDGTVTRIAFGLRIKSVQMLATSVRFMVFGFIGLWCVAAAQSVLAQPPQEDVKRIVGAEEAQALVARGIAKGWSRHGWGAVVVHARGLTVEAAQVIGGHKGTVCLTLDEMPDAVAKALAAHQGNLSITLSKDASEVALSAFNLHEGTMILKTPSDERVANTDFRFPNDPPSEQGRKAVFDAQSRGLVSKTDPAEPRDPELTDVPSLAVVASVLGSESKAYDRRGYKDVVLGETLEQVTAKLPLPFNQDARSWIYSPDQSGQRQFIFDQEGVLRCYVQQYDGGTSDYLEQIKELFGKTEKPVKEEQLHNSKAGVHGTSIDYTFPHTLVRVTFEQHVLAGGLEFEKTYITVLDRAWAQELLIRDIARKRSVVRLLKEALVLAREQDFDESKSPKIEGVVAVRNGDAVQWQLPTSAESAATGDGSEASDTSRICGQYGMLMDEYDLKPTVVFDFSKYTAVQKPPTLLVPDRAHNRSVDALAEAPFLWNLRLDCVSALTQALFTPQDGRVDFLQPRKPFLPRFFEWHYIDDQGNRWLVRVFSDGRVAAVLQSSKKKL